MKSHPQNVVLTDVFPTFRHQPCKLGICKLRSPDDILTGWTYPLKHSFIGVVNRSQQDANAENPTTVGSDSEKEFFATHPTYGNIAHTQGTEYLARALDQVSSRFQISIYGRFH